MQLDGLKSVEVVVSSSGATSAGHATGTGHTAGHATGSATSSLVDAHHDGVVLGLDLLLLGLVFLSISLGVGGAELHTLVGALVDELLVVIGELFLELLVVEGVLHLDAVRLKTVLGLNSLLDLVISILVLLSLVDHALNLFLGETALVVGDGDLLVLAGSLVHGRDVQDTVGIQIEGDLDLRGAAGSWGDALKVELAEQVAVLGHGALTLEDLNQDTGLVVSEGGEGLALLGGDGGVTGDKSGHDATGGLDTSGEGHDVEEEQVLDGLGLVAVENGSLDGGTVGDGLIGVDGLVELLAVEEVGEELLNLGDTGGATNEDDLVDGALGDVGVLEDLLDWGHALSEVGAAKLLELGAGQVGGVILTLGEGLAEDLSLESAGENSLGLLALGAETTESTVVALDVDAGLLLEVSNAVFDDLVVEIFTAQVSVTVGGLDLEDTVLNGEEGDIEGATTEIEDEDVALALALLVETVSDSGGGGLVDDTLNVETSDLTGVLGGLTLGVVEVSGDGDDGVLDSLSEVRFGDFLHLDKDHGGDLLSLESLGLSLELNNDEGLLAGAGLDLEGPELAISLDNLVRELAANEALGVEDSVGGVSGSLVLGGVTDEALLLSEGDVRGGGVDTLIVGDDFDLVVLEHTDA